MSNVNHHSRHTLRLISRSKWKRLKTLLRNVWNERKHATGNEQFIQNEVNKKLDRNTSRARETQAKTNVWRRSTFEACDITKTIGLSVSNINHHFRHTLRLTSRTSGNESKPYSEWFGTKENKLASMKTSSKTNSTRHWTGIQDELENHMVHMDHW